MLLRKAVRSFFYAFGMKRDSKKDYMKVRKKAEIGLQDSKDYVLF